VLLRFYNLIADLDPAIIPLPDSSIIEVAAEVVAAKDTHVLASAQAADDTH